MVIDIESINAGTLLIIGAIFLLLGITFLIISIVLNKKLEKRPIKIKQNPILNKNEIKKPDLPFLEEVKNQEQIDIVTGKEIPKIIIDRNNPEKYQEEIKPLEVNLEKETPIKLETDIIEIEENKENELVEEETNTNEKTKEEITNEESLEEISLNELEEELPTEEEPKEQPEFIEIEDESQKEIQKNEPIILKPKEVTINTTKPEKGKEQKINLEESEEEIELL